MLFISDLSIKELHLIQTLALGWINKDGIKVDWLHVISLAKTEHDERAYFTLERLRGRGIARYRKDSVLCGTELTEEGKSWYLQQVLVEHNQFLDHLLEGIGYS